MRADAYGRTREFAGPGPDGRWFTDGDAPCAGRLGGTASGEGPGGSAVPLCPFLYAGRRYDAETGLYYVRARYYDPDLGRFLSRDPLGYAAGANLYLYAGGNPAVYTDPDGELIFLLGVPLLLLAAGAIIGGLHGAAETYAADHNAGAGSYALGIGLGALLGALNPVGEFVSAGGAIAGGVIDYSTGGEFFGTGFQIGGLAGTLAGGFGAAARQGFLAASKTGVTRAAIWSATVRGGAQAVKWEAGGAIAGGAIGYLYTGTASGAYHGATLGMFAGGVTRGAVNVKRIYSEVRKVRANLSYSGLSSMVRRVPRSELKPGSMGNTSLFTGIIRIPEHLDPRSIEYGESALHEWVHAAGVSRSAFVTSVYHQVRESNIGSYILEEFGAEHFATGDLKRAAKYAALYIGKSFSE